MVAIWSRPLCVKKQITSKAADIPPTPGMEKLNTDCGWKIDIYDILWHQRGTYWC